jgi:transposase
VDNLSDHDTDEVNDWFDEHPRWTRHFTPKHASWLNQIENAFSILHRRVLAGGSWTSTQELQESIYSYLIWHNAHGKPFKWSYRPRSWSQNRLETSAEGN